MYDEAKEKKEQMDDFRVEVRNFIIINFAFSVVIREHFIKRFCKNNQLHISQHWMQRVCPLIDVCAGVQEPGDHRPA